MHFVAGVVIEQKTRTLNINTNPIGISVPFYDSCGFACTPALLPDSKDPPNVASGSMNVKRLPKEEDRPDNVNVG